MGTKASARQLIVCVPAVAKLCVCVLCMLDMSAL